VFANFTGTIDAGAYWVFAGDETFASSTNLYIAPGATITAAGTVSTNGAVGISGGLLVAGSLVNSSTITVDAQYGLALSGSGYLHNLTGAYITPIGSSAAVYGGPIDRPTVVNEGTIGGKAAYGIFFNDGGQITNTSTGYIRAGSDGIRTEGAIGATVVNHGNIYGFSHDGVDIGGGTVVNEGTIRTGTGAFGRYGVYICDEGGGAQLTNNSAGYIYGSLSGFFSLTTATVVNAGTITSSGNAGVYLTAGGYVGNSSTGLIHGYAYGIEIAGGAGSVVNDGTITNAATSGAQEGVDLAAGGSVTNGASGYVYGYHDAIRVRGETATVVNYGKIESYGYGIDLGVTGNARIINSGVIDSRYYAAIYIDPQLSAYVYNKPNGAITGYDCGIHINGDGTVVNAGFIAGYNCYGVSIAGTGSITVTSTGTVTGAGGVYLYNGYLGNSGTISGLIGVYAGSALHPTTIVNTATGIIRAGNGINAYGGQGNPAVVTNDGLIVSYILGVAIVGDSTFTNNGTIAPAGILGLPQIGARHYGSFGNQAAGTIINTGAIYGGVSVGISSRPASTRPTATG